ncbi:MAG: Rpn family recombination-promoting nuclease/putative transposase [Lachnospiraceae bacterium]|nr:Rpn family recombination-promoting nuclease/putative transposase [Lachnospiraceae bacterium]
MNTSKPSFHSAHGALPYTLTNDYLFRAVFQKNNTVLKGLICSLLHLSEEQVRSVTILNPIELGKAIDSKTFILDIKVILNDAALINLEMQVINHHFWPERSLSYLCRSFDSLNKGENYSAVKPVIHISFLDFTLFPVYPEFYSSYMLLNVKNNTIYSDKLKLAVVNLNQIELATKEDKLYHIDYWAQLFKATTWEEIKMLAAKNQYIQEASEALFELCAQDDIREQCEAREDYYRLERTLQSEHQFLVNDLQHTRHTLACMKDTLADTQNKLFDTQDKLSDTQDKLSDTQDKLSDTQGKLEYFKLENERLKAQLQFFQNKEAVTP